MNTTDSHFIYNQIISAVAENKEKISFSAVEHVQINRHEQSEFRNDITTEEELVKVLGQRWKTNLALLGSFVDVFQHITGRKEISEISVSVKSKRLVDIYKNPRNVSNVIALACKVDLLKCVNDKYRFGLYESYAKTYIYNKVVQDLIKGLIAKHNINYTKYIVRNNKTNDTTYISGNEFEIDHTKHYNVLFSSRLRIPHITDEQCLAYLYEFYPQLAHYQDIADEMNGTFLKEIPEQQIVFQPKITRSKGGYVTKIGIRATSSVVSLKEHESINPNYKGVWRKDYLKEFFGTDKYFEYDVKSSIYRVSYLMNYGEWLDNTYDFYELAYGKKFDSPAERAYFKEFAMRLYFDSPSTLYNHTKECYAGLLSSGISEQTIKDGITDLKAKLDYSIGNLPLGSEIFLHESCIYLDLVHELRKQGFKVVQIYDGFYSDQDIRPICEKILPVIAEQYQCNYGINQ